MLNFQIVGYARVSSVEQSENSYALDQQCQRLTDAGVQRIIQDVRSGATAKRKGLQELITLVKNKEIREVVITRIDRLTRNLTDLREFAQLCQSNEVNLKILDQSLDLSTPHGKMMLNMLGSLAEWERDLLIDRVKKGIKYQQDEKRVSGIVPFGYKRSEEGKYVLNCDLYKNFDISISDIARHLISIFLANGTIKGAAREFEKIYGVTEQSRGKNVGRLPPSFIGLKYWLQNPVLRGHLGYYYRSRKLETIITPNTHEALISNEQWTIIQKHLSILERKKTKPDSPYLPLAGLVYCALCGKKCKAFQKRTKKGILTHYWHCNLKYNPTSGCTGCQSFLNSQLEEIVIQKMKDKSNDLANSINIEESQHVDSPELSQARSSLLSIEALAPNQYLDEAIAKLQNQILIMELEQKTNSSANNLLRSELAEEFSQNDIYEAARSSNILRLIFRKFIDIVILPVPSEFPSITIHWRV